MKCHRTKINADEQGISRKRLQTDGAVVFFPDLFGRQIFCFEFFHSRKSGKLMKRAHRVSHQFLLKSKPAFSPIIACSGVVIPGVMRHFFRSSRFLSFRPMLIAFSCLRSSSNRYTPQRPLLNADNTLGGVGWARRGSRFTEPWGAYDSVNKFHPASGKIDEGEAICLHHYTHNAAEIV